MAAGERPPDPGGRTVSRSCRQPTVPGNEGRDGSARERVAEADDGGTCQALPTLLADYVKRARALLAEMRDLDASLHDQSQTPRGTIMLAADSVVREFLLPILVPGSMRDTPRSRSTCRRPARFGTSRASARTCCCRRAGRRNRTRFSGPWQRPDGWSSRRRPTGHATASLGGRPTWLSANRCRMTDFGWRHDGPRGCGTSYSLGRICRNSLDLHIMGGFKFAGLSPE